MHVDLENGYNKLLSADIVDNHEIHINTDDKQYSLQKETFISEIDGKHHVEHETQNLIIDERADSDSSSD